ncbi:MAG: hypothetical protein KC468_19825 [Myxococcales bacterium]|nr:hypothetical protein [Myxococcales bacterium]
MALEHGDWLARTHSQIEPQVRRWRILESDTGARGSWQTVANIQRDQVASLEDLEAAVDDLVEQVTSPCIRLQALYGRNGVDSTFDIRSASSLPTERDMAPAIVAQVLAHNGAMFKTSILHYDSTIAAQNRTIEDLRKQNEALLTKQIELVDLWASLKDEDVTRQAKVKAIEKGGELVGTLIDAVRMAVAKKSGTPVDNLLAAELRKFGNSLTQEQIAKLGTVLREDQMIPLLTVILEPEKAQAQLKEGEKK